jgi:hypothetical protein
MLMERRGNTECARDEQRMISRPRDIVEDDAASTYMQAIDILCHPYCAAISSAHVCSMSWLACMRLKAASSRTDARWSAVR